MIYKKVSGRLGNQMFQYASTRGILARNGIVEKVMLDFSEVYDFGFKNDLENFNVKHYVEVNKPKLNVSQYIMLAKILVYEKLLKFKYKDIDLYDKKKHEYELKNKDKFTKHGVIKLFDGYTEFNLQTNKDYAIFGLLESKKYFDNIRSEILEEFTPKHDRIKENKELYDIIENTNSVCVSVRRGDFLDSENKDRHFVCDLEYFKNAIEIIRKSVENPKFIIFSDDVEWCKKEFAFLENASYESGKDPVWEKLRLMYSCKHFIISNSTFSWWAQYLSRNESKIVIAPQKWKNFGVYEDIYDEKWIKI